MEETKKMPKIPLIHFEGEWFLSERERKEFEEELTEDRPF